MKADDRQCANRVIDLDLVRFYASSKKVDQSCTKQPIEICEMHRNQSLFLLTCPTGNEWFFDGRPVQD